MMLYSNFTRQMCMTNINFSATNTGVVSVNGSDWLGILCELVDVAITRLDFTWIYQMLFSNMCLIEHFLHRWFVRGFYFVVCSHFTIFLQINIELLGILISIIHII